MWCIGERRDSLTYMVLVGKSEGKRSLGRPRRRWEDSSKMGIQQIGGGGRGLDCFDSG
jgi:hypothetical protein